MPDVSPQPFALWAIPTPSDRRWLAKIIQDFAQDYETPTFEPHLTVYSGMAHPDESLEALLTTLQGQTEPFQLQVAGLDYTDNFLRTGFIAFEPSDRLAQLYQDVRGALRQPIDYELNPHLSLIYKQMSLEKKRLAMLRIVLSVQAITFDSLKIVMPGAQGWEDIAGWTEPFQCVLSR